MRRLPQTSIVVAAAIPALFVLGCDSSRPTTPALIDASALSAALDRGSNRVQLVTLRDDCDPTTFNAAIGPNTCVRAGNGMPFDRFIAELTSEQSVGAWKMDPKETDAAPGTVLVAMNRGGETHTFTRVAAPATLQFLLAGASLQSTVGTGSIERYQCCIHPWMRLEVHQHHS